MPWIVLVIAGLFEVVWASAMKQSHGFTRLWPSVISVVGYAGAFWFLSFPLRHMPTGVVYAIWSGLGIVLITMVAWIWAKQALDLAAILGLALILAGVLVIHLFWTRIAGLLFALFFGLNVSADIASLPLAMVWKSRRTPSPKRQPITQNLTELFSRFSPPHPWQQNLDKKMPGPENALLCFLSPDIFVGNMLLLLWIKSYYILLLARKWVLQ